MKQLLLLISAITCLQMLVNGQQAGTNTGYDTPEALIRDVYKAVSAKDGESVDWVKVRSFFLNEAIVILRTATNESKQFTVDGFIQDFKTFYQEPGLKSSAGFEEKILPMKSMVFKDIACITTVYSEAITGRSTPPGRGVDLLAMSSIKKAVLFNTSMINAVESRTTKGVQVMKPKDGSTLIKVKRLENTKLADPEYYLRSDSLNTIGFYLKPGDEI